LLTPVDPSSSRPVACLKQRGSGAKVGQRNLERDDLPPVWPAAQSVKNLVKRYEKLPYKAFPTPAHRKDAPPEIPVVSWEDRRSGCRVRLKGFHRL